MTKLNKHFRGYWCEKLLSSKSNSVQMINSLCWSFCWLWTGNSHCYWTGLSRPVLFLQLLAVTLLFFLMKQSKENTKRVKKQKFCKIHIFDLLSYISCFSCALYARWVKQAKKNVLVVVLLSIRVKDNDYVLP